MGQMAIFSAGFLTGTSVVEDAHGLAVHFQVKEELEVGVQYEILQYLALVCVFLVEGNCQKSFLVKFC
jgi:hypothetical protein